MQGSKGMVQVAGITYRITRLGPGDYAAIRILDDKEVGRFTTNPQLRVTSWSIERVIMEEIARVAIRASKQSWRRRLFINR